MTAIIEEIGNGCERHGACAANGEQHGLPIGPSGLCNHCEFEAYAERCGEYGAILDADGSCPECDAEWGARAARDEDAWLGAEVESVAPKSQCSTLEFPRHALVGSVGDLARLLAKGTEVPEEFYFATGLTVLGAICGDRLKLTLACDVEPRLY